MAMANTQANRQLLKMAPLPRSDKFWKYTYTYTKVKGKWVSKDQPKNPAVVDGDKVYTDLIKKVMSGYKMQPFTDAGHLYRTVYTSADKTSKKVTEYWIINHPDILKKIRAGTYDPVLKYLFVQDGKEVRVLDIDTINRNRGSITEMEYIRMVGRSIADVSRKPVKIYSEGSLLATVTIGPAIGNELQFIWTHKGTKYIIQTFGKITRK